ncbi:HTH_XRE domain containing protein [uncultured Caudovirales phage]|uniref:HTH_XRE domain containing protein n=1 Tax=uncultured Caudovirales phage TaxID=2100421 RepID=A0A6J5SD81_9CAUD|nr:HTH_XRE domain containing protein [uncultured Caudovirales phage]
MDDLKKISGDRIRAFRKMKRLTLEKFAEPLSIKYGTVSDYERGKALASESVIREIEQHYRLNRKWYETGEGEMLLPADPDPYPNGADKWKRHVNQIPQDHVAETNEELYSEEYREMLKITKNHPIARLALLEIIKLSEEDQLKYYQKAKAAAQSMNNGLKVNVSAEKPTT